MDELTMQVTEDQVLAGELSTRAKLRKGGTRDLRIKALPWRVALQSGALFAAGDTGAATILVLNHALDEKERQEQRMDEIVPSELIRLANLANLLTNGLESAAKKPLAKPEAPDLSPASLPSAS